MKSIILSTATQYLLPLLLLLSVYLLLHGHNVPGGGFIGGLVAAAALSLYCIAHGVPAARKILIIDPMTLSNLGLLLAFTSGVLSYFFGKPFLTGLWSKVNVPVLGKLGTPMLFDVGVYAVVVGVTLTIIFTLEED